MRRALLALALLVAVAAPQAGATPMLGEQRVLVLLLTWGPEPYTREQVRKVVFDDAAAWFRDASYGRTSLAGDVTPWLHALPSRPECNQRQLSRIARAAAQAAGYSAASYQRFVFVHPRIDCPFAGLGTGEEAWLNGALGRMITVHELGHTYGLAHANTWDCHLPPCRPTEYGNPYSVMGNGEGHFTAFEKVSLGWLSNVTVAAASGEYDLHRLEVPTAGPQALKITTARNEYWLELRAPTLDTRGRTSPGGVLVNAGANPFAALNAIPQYEQYNLLLPDPAGRGSPALLAGDVFREAGAFELSVSALADGAARLRFGWTDTKAPRIDHVQKPRAVGRLLEVTWAEAAETGSGVAYYEVAVDRAKPARVPTGLTVATTKFVRRPARGTHTVSVVAVDRAGNRGPAATRRFVLR